jgi:hypothetical protein
VTGAGVGPTVMAFHRMLWSPWDLVGRRVSPLRCMSFWRRHIYVSNSQRSCIGSTDILTADQSVFL